MKLEDAPHFMTVESLAIELSHYTYRHGWKLRLFVDAWEGPCLYVVAQLDDAYHPGDKVEVRIRSNIPPMPNEYQFGHWLLWRLGQIELHECREFLRKDGKPLFDPHDPIEP